MQPKRWTWIRAIDNTYRQDFDTPTDLDHQTTSLHRRLLKIGMRTPDPYVPSTDRFTTQQTAESFRSHLWKRRRDSFWKIKFLTNALHNIKWKTAHQSTHEIIAIIIIIHLYTMNNEYNDQQSLIQTSDQINSTILSAKTRYQESTAHYCYFY